MNVSVNWLKQYVDIEDISVKELSDGLTHAGLEVEGRTDTAKVTGVVTAKCLTREKHPNADKLSLCTVTDGKDSYQVVCGAPNIAAGQVVAFAKVGATLPAIQIKEAKIRGIDSFGMICSEAELGATQDHSGIIVLPENTPLGIDINDMLGLGDSILALNVTPNRPDWLSVVGVAREVSAVFGRKIKLPPCELKECSLEAKDVLSVDVKDTDKCPTYTARVIKGVKIAPSPLWMQARLRSCGIRAINNVVDITNYILMEYAQPLHAFDLRQVDKGIVVRCAKSEEKIVTLDGKEYTLTPDMLVIADHSKALGVAGVMGGEYTGIENDTDTVVLECAYFAPDTVRSTSKRLGLSSDSSYRFERGIDRENVINLSDYAAMMIANICGGEVLKGRVGGVYQEAKPQTVVSDALNINKLLGTNIPAAEMGELLNRLQIMTKVNNEILESVSPSFRVDIERECDIAEEVARLYGYDKIGTTIPAVRSDADIMLPELRFSRSVRRDLAALGFSEVVNYSFMESGYLTKFDENGSFVKLLNPISVDMAWLRTLVFPAVLKNLQTNWNQGHTNIKLFEISKSFHSNGAAKLATETQKLALGVMGDFMPVSWVGGGQADTFYMLKGTADNIFDGLNLTASYEKLTDCAFLHPGKSAKVSVNGKAIGFIGALHPIFAESLDFKAPVYIAEFDFSLLAEMADAGKFRYSKFSRFPYVERDIAVVVENAVEAGKALVVIKEFNELIQNVVLFDDYSGKGIDDGCKSIAFRITFSCMTKTLSDEEINPIIEDILKTLESKFGAKLR